MKSHIQLLDIHLYFQEYRIEFLCFLTAFVIALVGIPPIIHIVKRYRLYDIPDHRKEHKLPIPTMGGIAIVGGMAAALALWFPYQWTDSTLAFVLSVAVLFLMGIMDDIKDLSAKFKMLTEIVLAVIVVVAGIRITSLNGLFGIYELPIAAQYVVTIVAIVGVTNAFNLIDGIDGLAGGLGFMSLMVLGIFLSLSNQPDMALMAFAMAGALLAFLYFNFNPAKIFMGDTGSLVLGFVIAVLGIRLMQANSGFASGLLKHAPVFVLGIVLVPVFDTLRVFAERIWKGRSPFHADKTHIHHLLTNAGYSHAFAVKMICSVHALILIEIYWLKELRQEWILLLIVAATVLATIAFRNLHSLRKKAPIREAFGEIEMRA